MSQMNIKDETVIAEAKALAELLGTTATDAVRRAVHDRLERERQALTAEQERRFQVLMAISEEASKLFPPGSSSDHSDLYDEDGLPA